MKWKVMLVDDELLVRHHLKTLLNWEKEGFTLCGEAGDGIDAMKKVESLQPDIIIVDMSMPGMNGLELTRYLSESFPHIEVIVLSSYDSFDYVRGTLSFGAVDYLLKHSLTQKSLIEVLDKVSKLLKAKREEQRIREFEEKKRERVGLAVSQTYLQELLLGTFSDLNQSEEYVREVLGKGNPGWVLLLIQVVNFELLTTRLSEQEMSLFVRSVTDLCGQSAGDSRSGCSAYMERGKFALLISCSGERSEHAINQRLISMISRLETSLQLYLDAPVFVVKSPLIHSLQTLHETYESLGQKMEEMSGQRPGNLGQKKESAPAVTIGQEKRLLSAMEAADALEAVLVVKEIFEQKVGSNGASLQGAASELMQTAAKIIRKAGLDADWIYQEMAKLQRDVFGAESALSIISEVFIKTAAELQKNRNVTGLTRHVKQASKLIQQHYQQGLTLEEAADLLGITPSYLSRLFKDETGRTFTEYVTEYRIERGKQFILDGDLRIKDIYKRLGFNSYSYFIKVFKDVTGETPFGYAKRIREKS